MEDLCKFVELLIEKSPEQHIFNVGNKYTADICEWVKLCYNAAGKSLSSNSLAAIRNGGIIFLFMITNIFLTLKNSVRLCPIQCHSKKDLKERTSGIEPR